MFRRTVWIILNYFVFVSCYHAQNLVRKELLGRPTNNSITIQMLFDDSVNVRVQYGTVSGIYNYQTPWQLFTGSVTTEVVLTALAANTKYYYRVNYRHPGTNTLTTRPEFSFRTQRAIGDSFVFVVQADPHMDASSDTALYRRCLQNQLADHPDFMIDLGDFLMTDKLVNTNSVVPHDTITYRCKLLRSRYEFVCHSMPLFIALGNHEAEAGWYLNNTANNMAVWDAQERKKYFPNPYPDAFYTGDTVNYNFIGKRGSYYAWTWGDAQFIVLDPYWYTNPKPDATHGWYWSLGKVQYDWLKKTLENSTSKFKFVFAHQIVGGDSQGRGGVEFADKFEWGGNNLDGSNGWQTNRPGWYKPIKDLLEEHRVNIFFHGHDHFFGKQQLECLIYQETPQPSLPNFNYPTQAAAYGYLQGLILSNTGHLRVSVSPSGTKVEYVKAYLPSQENATHHNGDIVATYYIANKNCYDTLFAAIPTLWNSNYADEVVYPNPFQTETKIKFSMRYDEKISIIIYNEQGLAIRTLLDPNIVSQGNYQVIWDGKNSLGMASPNGVYFYKIIGESIENKGQAMIKQSGKMVLLKQ